MLDIGTLSVTEPPQREWRDRIQDGLAGYFQSLARSISPQNPDDALGFDKVRAHRHGLMLRVRNQDRSALLMLFDGVETEAWQAFGRARGILGELAPLGLAPELIAICEPRRFLLLKDAPKRISFAGQDVEKNADNAYLVGQWLAQVDAMSPQQAACGNWFDYLNKNADRVGFKPSGRAADTLCTIPVCGYGLARDASASEGLLADAQGRVMGWDFDQTELRPRGWDYVLTYRALRARSGAQETTVLTALSDGFASNHVGGLKMDELDRLGRALAAAAHCR